jgi:uncharacterized protein YggE
MHKAFALTIMFVAGSALAQMVPAMSSTITVNGTGSVKLVPDRFSFSVGVASVSPRVRDAFAETNRKIRAVIDALQKDGVMEAQLQTSNYSIYTPYDPETKGAVVYGVRSDVTVTRDNPKGASDLIQSAVDAGANQVGSLRFFVDDPRPARQLALERAYGDAHERAMRLATVAGKTLGDPITISTEGLYQPAPIVEAITVSAAAPALESGMTVVTATVTVTFTLEPAAKEKR